MSTTVNDLAERYVAMWNEPGAQARRAQIAALWAEDCAHYTPSMEMHGRAAMEQRMTIAWEKWVRE